MRFADEWHDDAGNWFRSYGNENWELDENGLMDVRHASINDLPIKAADRKFFWPPGRRPDDHLARPSWGYKPVKGFLIRANPHPCPFSGRLLTAQVKAGGSAVSAV